MAGRVRVDVGKLEAAMRARGLTAQQLELAGAALGKRSINRWLRVGRQAPDGVVSVRWTSLSAVAHALGVDPASLVDGPAPDQAFGYHALLRLVAGLGPVVYPDLVRALLAQPGDLEEFLASDWFEPEPIPGAAVASQRVRRWAVCQDILDDQTLVPAALARKALAWCERRGLSVAVAPELHCLCSGVLGRVRPALEAGWAWMQAAYRRGSLAEVRWVGGRLRRLDTTPDDLVLVAEVALLHAQTLSIAGSADVAIDVLAELSLAAGHPVLEARILMERAAAHEHVGELHRGARVARAAVDLLADDEPGREFRLQALMQVAYLADGAGDTHLSAAAREDLDLLIGSDRGAWPIRMLRISGIEALNRARIGVAIEAFLEAVDIAEHVGDAREAGIGRLNVALCYAMLDDPELARASFEQVANYIAAGHAGPFAVALFWRNFGQFELEHGAAEVAATYLDRAVAQYRGAGHHPGRLCRCNVLRAEAAAALGRSTLADRYARAAYRDALDAGDDLDQALALCACVMATDPGPANARRLLAAARRLLDRVPAAYRRIERVRAEHLYYELALNVAPADLRDSQLDALRALLLRAERSELRAEVRRIRSTINRAT